MTKRKFQSSDNCNNNMQKEAFTLRRWTLSQNNNWQWVIMEQNVIAWWKYCASLFANKWIHESGVALVGSCTRFMIAIVKSDQQSTCWLITWLMTRTSDCFNYGFQHGFTCSYQELASNSRFQSEFLNLDSN